ncbi:MAG: M15 family metallopeptidase [Erysipelotrichaceae bacterium]|nr:M15 family metallopeptidase [Erysipelotrichaceae bacterium]
MTVKKKKRRLNGRFLALVFASIMIILSIFKVPKFINTNKLTDLGYSNEAVTAIYKKGLKSTIIKNQYYSDYLNQEIVKETFNQKYLRLYLCTSYLDDKYFNLYEKLKAKKGYSDEEMELLLANLKYDGLTPLLVFDKVENIEDYIEDYKAHSSNNKKQIALSNDYLNQYENYATIEDPSAEDVFVSSKNYLGEYAPEKLAPINSQNAINGIYMESRALDKYYELCAAIREADASMAIYAVGGYISYESQAELAMTGTQYIKAGFSDTQTGLGVYVVSSENESVSRFNETRAYEWLLKNAHKYGFIQRFPEGKEALTGHSVTNNYFRYVGVELATKIYESGLSFDEYYYQYID